MENNINFNELWMQQKSTEVDVESLHAQIKKVKNSQLRKLLVTNLLLIATSIFIIFIWVFYQPQLLSTKIGIILVILAMFIYLLAYNKSYSLLKSDMNGKSNKEYLQSLLSLKAKQQFMHGTMLNLYFVLLSLGMGLYMYEYTSRMTIFWGVFAYFITTLWILFNWFYLRPMQIKKQRSKLEEVIQKLESMNKQLE